MRCSHALTALSPFLDGRLEPGRLAELDRHLQDCPACMAELNALRAADAVAQRALPEEPLSPGFVADLERRIAREGDLVRPAGGGLTVRAVIPMAAAVLLGATVTFLGMQAGRPHTPEAGPGDTAEHRPSPDTGPVEHAPIAAEYGEALNATDQFAARADVVLTNLSHLSTHDPASELALVRNESEAVGLRPAIATARASVQVFDQCDPMRARALGRALDGTDAVLRRLEQDGTADRRLIAARREMLRRQLQDVIRNLASNGVPRPRRGATGNAAGDGTTPGEMWRAAFRRYADGDLAAAGALFRKFAAQAKNRDEQLRGTYWVAKTSLLEGKPHITLKLLPRVQAASPDAAADISKQMRFVLTSSGGGTLVIAEADGDIRLLIEGEIDPDTEIHIDPSKVRAEQKKQMEQVRKQVLEMQQRIKREFEQMPRRDRSDVRTVFETAELPKPRSSHYYFRTTAVRVDGTEVKLADAGRVLCDTTPVIAYRIRRMRPARVTAGPGGTQIHAFDVWDRPEDLTRKVSRRIQFGSWEAQQFVEELQKATGRSLHDKQRFSTFKTIEFVVEAQRRSQRHTHRKTRTHTKNGRPQQASKTPKKRQKSGSK
jgi:anti-sigma factor RsiW